MIGLGAWSGCKQDVDVAPPSVELLRFDPAPREGNVCGTSSSRVFFLTNGQSLTFELIFRDNEALSQYKIDVHSNFDCHGHARKTEDWTVLEVVDISGTEQQVNRSLRVPAEVTSGNYHFQIQVIDAAGNQEPLGDYYDLQIVNLLDTVPPQLSVSQPDNQSLSLARGEELRLVGSVMDNYSLGEGGNGRLLLTYRAISSGNILTANEIEWPETQGQRADFDFGFEIPRTLTTGRYEYVLSAYDGVNNESERLRYEVEVTP